MTNLSNYEINKEKSALSALSDLYNVYIYINIYIYIYIMYRSRTIVMSITTKRNVYIYFILL